MDRFIFIMDDEINLEEGFWNLVPDFFITCCKLQQVSSQVVILSC